MNKWDIKKKTKLRYPRVHETIKILEKTGAVKQVGKKKIKNKLPSPVYGLTFKGVMIYLSLQELTKLELIGTQGEEELKERFLRSYKKRFEELQKLQNQLRIYGKDFSYPIFSQMDWLLDNYNWMVLDIVLNLSRYLLTNPEPFTKSIRKQQKTEENQLTKSIERFKKVPFLQKITSYRDDGNRRVIMEYDILKEKENRLKQLRNEMAMLAKNESEYLKKTFAYEFFIRLSYLTKNKKDGNKALAEMATRLLEEKRRNLSPLENILKKLEGKNN